MKSPSLKISELISKLQEQQNKYGDLPCVLEDGEGLGDRYVVGTLFRKKERMIGKKTDEDVIVIMDYSAPAE